LAVPVASGSISIQFQVWREEKLTAGLKSWFTEIPEQADPRRAVRMTTPSLIFMAPTLLGGNE
jgi:hypothetical protein